MTSPRISSQYLPPGEAGTRTTLQAMRRLVNASLPLPRVREAAKDAVTYVDPRDTLGQARAIRRWLEERYRFIADPRGVELVHSPAALLREIDARYYFQGDCDDLAVLGAALGKSIGLRARFVVLGFAGRRGFSHVFTELLTRQGWLDLDLTRSAQPPQVARAQSFDV